MPRPDQPARISTVDQAEFQRLQAFEDAIAYRHARLALPCPDCGPPPARCDDHAADHDLIAGYRRQRRQIAARLQAQHQAIRDSAASPNPPSGLTRDLPARTEAGPARLRSA
jgi:hypothetical protein